MRYVAAAIVCAEGWGLMKIMMAAVLAAVVVGQILFVVRADPSAKIAGVVLFARGYCASWITPFFTLREAWR